ncbi:MAG: HAD-IB family hydrolase [Bacteroidetes bacterium]|nr:HAD-IB family hydrolase [Bacteroidota bacterium]
MKRRIAFFDFDGTITNKDSFLELIKFQKGPLLFYTGFLLNAPFLLAYKLKIISNSSAKERILRFFFNKTTLNDFQLKCDRFAMQNLPEMVRPKAIMEIRKLQELSAEVVIVSASAKNWLLKWSDAQQVALIATLLEVRNEKITGCIDGKNCFGEEKVARIQSQFDLSQYDEIYCYGDTSGDNPMLALATHAFYKPFR